MKTNPSQYPGTLKNSVCRICNANVSNMNSEQQEKHAKKCLEQQRL